MRKGGLLLAVAFACLPMMIRAQTPVPASVQIWSADEYMHQARFREALDAYRKVMATPGAGVELVRRARKGLVLALLRTGDFAGALTVAESLVREAPGSEAGQGAPAGDRAGVLGGIPPREDARMMALYGDALWAGGLFDEAEHAYARSLAADSSDARAIHGHARALAARSRLSDALVEVQRALAIDPGDPEFHHTLGLIYERQHRFPEASAAFTEYVSLLPNRDDSLTALWARAEIKFLDSFKGKTPIDFGDRSDTTWTVPFKIRKDKVLVAVRVNDGSPEDFVLDSGAEQTVVSRDVARRRGILPITYMHSAGVGDIGLRGLQVGRIDMLQVGDLKVRNVPCLIKNPPLGGGGLPSREPDSFSPIALGLSMRIDYVKRQLVMARTLPDANYETELPLRMYRLATVRGVVNGQPATFVVDTGGEVLSISLATAGLVSGPNPYRRIPLKVYGTSGWDKDAYLMPNVDLAFNSIRFSKVPVVVLNLKAPSVLLGFELGGIVGHKFLSQYRVSIDLTRSVVGLDTTN